MDRVVARARRVELAARRLLEGRLPGRHRSLFRGHGVELAEIRPYQPGDDFRSIDWNVTARTGRPHVKQVEEERELPLLLAVDVSGSLDFGTARRTKRERAAEVAAVLGLAALRDGHPVGQLLFTDRLEGEYVAPGRGRGRLRRLLTSLVAPAEGSGTDLSRGLDAARLLTRRRSLVVIVTDLVGVGDFGRCTDWLKRPLMSFRMFCVCSADTLVLIRGMVWLLVRGVNLRPPDASAAAGGDSLFSATAGWQYRPRAEPL